MVNAMTRGPKDWATLQCHGRTNCKEVFNDLRGFVRSMGVGTVVPQPNPPTDTSPMQNKRDHHRLPSSVENGYHRKNVKHHHRGHCDPIDLRLVTKIDMAEAQSRLLWKLAY